MAIYRPRKSRWPLVVGVATLALIVGLVAGLLASRGDDTPAAEDIRSALLAAAGSVEVASIEYEEAVAGGSITSETEYSGAQDALASGKTRYQEVREELRALAPERVEQIDTLFEEAEGLMSDAAEPTEVVPALEELEEALKGNA